MKILKKIKEAFNIATKDVYFDVYTFVAGVLMGFMFYASIMAIFYWLGIIVAAFAAVVCGLLLLKIFNTKASASFLIGIALGCTMAKYII